MYQTLTLCLRFCKIEKAIHSFFKLRFLKPTCLALLLHLSPVYSSVLPLPEPSQLPPPPPAFRTSLAAGGEESAVDVLQTLIIIIIIIIISVAAPSSCGDARSDIQLEKAHSSLLSKPKHTWQLSFFKP